MQKGNGNGVWKWIAVVVVTALFSILGYVHSQDMGTIATLATKQQKTDDSLATAIRWGEVSITRINTIGAVNNQWQQMIEKKMDLILKKLNVPEYEWPSVQAHTTGGQ